MNGPCTWPVVYTCVEPDWTPEAKALSEQMATELLWNWTGRSYGLCQVAARPCKTECSQGLATFWGRGPYVKGGYGPVLVAGEWLNIFCGTCGDACSCDNPATLRLPGPVDSIEEVLIDGTVLAPSSYRVDARSLLVRTDGGGWPACQSLGLAAAEPGTWQVTYTRGEPVPSGGQVAGGTLAVELFKASCNDATCQLPRRVSSISRQGVTIALLDAFDDVTKGRTGIWLIDGWVASVTKSPKRSRVYSPDTPRPGPRVQTWPTTP
jgi:hypothetical protein